MTTAQPTTLEVVEINPPQKLKMGGYNPMHYDAVLHYRGVDWYRVHLGMGGRGDREDWVADTPGVGVSIHDYDWKPEKKRFDNDVPHPSMEAAMDKALQRGLARARHYLHEVKEKVATLEAGVAILTAAITS